LRLGPKPAAARGPIAAAGAAPALAVKLLSHSVTGRSRAGFSLVCRAVEPPSMRMIESILADAAAIAAVRRDIHAHPELCFQEQRTADVIAKQLTDWGIPVHRGMGKTGVVGIRSEE